MYVVIRLPSWKESQAPSTRIHFQMKTQLYFCVLAYCLHENGKSVNENATLFLRFSLLST